MYSTVFQFDPLRDQVIQPCSLEQWILLLVILCVIFTFIYLLVIPVIQILFEEIKRSFKSEEKEKNDYN